MKEMQIGLDRVLITDELFVPRVRVVESRWLLNGRFVVIVFETFALAA
jgi:hypothetical protein